MKVFEVIVFRTSDISTEVTEERRFVTSEDDSLLSVVKHYTKYCEEFNRDLISVREVLNVVEHLGA
jgi:thioredoxin-related protein